MLDDERQTGKKVVNDIRSQRTAFGSGANVIKTHWPVFLFLLLFLVYVGIIPINGFVEILSIGAIASILDWSMIVDILPLFRLFPRIVISLDALGGALITIGAGTIISIITVIGGLRMGIPYYLERKFGDE